MKKFLISIIINILFTPLTSLSLRMGFFFPQSNILAVIVYLLFVGLNTFTLYFVFEYFSRLIQKKSLKVDLLHKRYFLFIYLGYIFVFLFARGPIYEPFRVNLDITNSYYPGTESNFFILIFNLLIFAPLAFIKQIKFFHAITIFILIEFLQTFLGIGIFDINDIIYYFIGYISTKLLITLFKK